MRDLIRPPGVLAVMVLFLIALQTVFPQEESGSGKSRGDHLTLKVAVMGPGDALYFWWGHIALIIEDDTTGKARFYDWGLFSFENEHFYVNFALGRLLYSCGASPANANINAYIKNNRDVIIYTLDIPVAEKEEVWHFAENNILPENRNYYYHHFRDNCSTRIRDILDLATEGQFKERFGEAPGRYTLRQHVRRHTWFSPFFDWLLNFLMGQDIDKPITVWEELFLPAEVGTRIADFRYVDPSGIERNLVSSVEVLNKAVNRPAVLAVPRRQWPRELLLGLGIGALLAAGMILQEKKPVPYRRLFGVSQSILGLFFGIAGSVLFFMTLFTNHDYTYHNSNILYINPLLLAAIPLGIVYAQGKDEKKRFVAQQLLRALWTYMVFGCILSMLIKGFPGFYQQNQVTQALVLPFAVVLSFIPEWVRRLFSRALHP
ncbi:MAG: DUF4105 domain-containing protein [Treponema sp.]|jgi:hypothetical protein|nr:DUF4105 domain-containing protein [Treponema sp.]